MEKELIKCMKDCQDKFDKLIRKLGHERKKIMEARIRLENDNIKLRELHQIFDEVINSLSPEAEQKIQDIVESLYGLQGELTIK